MRAPEVGPSAWNTWIPAFAGMTKTTARAMICIRYMKYHNHFSLGRFHAAAARDAGRH
jgi:hypothetical protein